MSQITPPPMNRAEAQMGVVKHMLAEQERATELFLVNGQLYRIHVERVATEDVPEAARQFMEEQTCPPPKHTS